MRSAKTRDKEDEEEQEQRRQQQVDPEELQALAAMRSAAARETRAEAEDTKAMAAKLMVQVEARRVEIEYDRLRLDAAKHNLHVRETMDRGGGEEAADLQFFETTKEANDRIQAAAAAQTKAIQDAASRVPPTRKLSADELPSGFRERVVVRFDQAGKAVKVTREQLGQAGKVVGSGISAGKRLWNKVQYLRSLRNPPTRRGLQLTDSQYKPPEKPRVTVVLDDRDVDEAQFSVVPESPEELLKRLLNQ